LKALVTSVTLVVNFEENLSHFLALLHSG